LKGARWFSYDELKKCTNNFSGSNELGFGGYGKVFSFGRYCHHGHQYLTILVNRISIRY
jgi:hypothetical protein